MLANHKGEIPFFTLLMPFILGIGLGIWFPQVNILPLWVTAGLSTLAFIFLNIYYQQLKLYKYRWLGGAIIHLLLLFTGWAATINYNELNDSSHFSRSKAQYQVVVINNEPALKNGILRFTATVKQNINNKQANTVNGNLLIAIKDTAAHIAYGDVLLLPANYQPVAGPANPAEFNYKRYLSWQNIHFQSFLNDGKYRVIGHEQGNPLIAASLKLRKKLVSRFQQQMHSPEAISVASTLILGYKADLSDDVLQAYSKTGTVHVLSVSGAHVAIVLLLLEITLGFMNRFRHGKAIKATIIVGFIWYYAMLSSFSPAVCRAAVMISFFIVGKTLNRYINTLNIMALSAMLLLFYDPYFIADVGFQLSYLAVFGLVVFQPIVYKCFDINNKWLDKLWQLCSVSIAAQVITFPLSIFYFHQFPVYFLASNLLIIIPTTVIMYAGIGCLLFWFVPVLSALFAKILEWTIMFMDHSLMLIENAPYSGISRIWITDTQYILLFIFIIALFGRMHQHRKWLLYSSLICLLLFCCIGSYRAIKILRSDEMIVLKLKKHQGVIYRRGDKAVIVTDVADTSKTFRYSIRPYVDSCNVEKITLLNSNKFSTGSNNVPIRLSNQ